jgi:vacuolar-type H+-ATPase subunit H
MKKLAMLGVLAAALAWNARADDTQEKKAEAQADLQKAQTDAQKEVGEAKTEASKEVGEAKAEASKEVGEAQAQAQEKVGEAKEDAAEKTRDAAAEGTASGSAAAGQMAHPGKHPVFTKDNFDLKGTVQSASADSITVQRKDLPAAKLSLDQNTKIEVEGQSVSAAQLQPGQEVKASFNLQDDKPMAVEIKAKKK